ncbi:MAG: lytic transglycosylase domain-containing protein [Calditrichaeota bacterium]|nr:MAG: lytic transglycosylase domain-containing protein [Calditrichota bacterium]
MKLGFKKIILVVIIGMLVGSGCNSPSTTSVPSSSGDTLIAMVEKEIAKKKEREKAIQRFRTRYLPPYFDRKIQEYYPIIRKYSKRYGIDWRLIVVQILKESYFKENARSEVGAMGLMQIMPRTAREITRELDIERIAKDPRENIAAGIYHLYKQLKYFPEADPVNRLKLALAAYNCGPGRIFDARDIARYKQRDPNSWEAVREYLTMLTPEHWQLHLEVWEQGVPPHGYFYGYEQTIDYVDDIYENYQLIKHMF